mgnify:CR=1 FL=1
MCNLYSMTRNVDAVRSLFKDAGLTLSFPEGVPNFQPRDVRITDKAPIVRLTAEGAHELVERRWSWPGPGGKPVFNYRADGRKFSSGRCLILADAFYEFVSPDDPSNRRKKRIRFRPADGGAFSIAGLVREDATAGEAFTMLTMPPGPDVAPYHGRQVAVLRPELWAGWLSADPVGADFLPVCERGSLVADTD